MNTLELEAKVAQLEAACAAMREALGSIRGQSQWYSVEQEMGIYKVIDKAISTDAGKSLLAERDELAGNVNRLLADLSALSKKNCTLLDRLQAVEKERDEYSTALAMICSSPPKYAKPIAEAALKVSEADIAQFLKEYDEGKHPLSAEDEAALECSRPELVRRLKALQPDAQKEQ